MTEILTYIYPVVEAGRMSESRRGYGDCYCGVTTFKSGIVVYADRNKKSDRLIVVEDERARG